MSRTRHMTAILLAYLANLSRWHSQHGGATGEITK
jgi:hypothetical protein